jgi:hypothetical protein
MGGIDLPKTGILDSLASKSTCRLAEEIWKWEGKMI